MTLEELKQVKKDTEQGIMVSKNTWANVLHEAIALKQFELSQIAAVKLNQVWNNSSACHGDKLSPLYNPPSHPPGMEPPKPFKSNWWRFWNGNHD